MRAGESPQHVAAQTGWPIERVERYAEQPLAERAFIAEQALSVEIRRSGAAVSVRDTAVDVLARAGLNFDDLVVDSARRADGKWSIDATLPGSSLAAVWVYDHTARSLQPGNDDARRLMGVEPAPPVADAPVEAPAVEPRPRLVAVPDAKPVDDLDATDDQVRQPQDAVAPDESAAPSAHQETLTLPVPPAPEQPASSPKPKPRGKGRRASVPSWDEILFGSSGHDGN